MAKKQTVSDNIKEIRETLIAKKEIVGKDRVIKELKQGKLAKIFVASNCPKFTMDDINHYAKLANVEIVQLKYDNEELGVFCKRQFFISVLGIGA